ncbi:MAG: PAS domain S-box protein [bacterium]
MNEKDKPLRCKDIITNHLMVSGFGLGILYWITKSAIYAYTYQGTLIEHLFPLDQKDLFIRLIVIALFTLFGLLMEATIVKRQREELKQVNEQLRQERGKLEAVMQQIPSAIVISEAPSGRIVLGNKQTEEIWRQPVLLSANVEEYGKWKGFHLEDGRPYRGEEWPLGRSVLYGEVVIDEEADILRGDGTHGTISIRSAPIRDSEGKITAAVVIFNDITGRRQNEEMRSRLAAIVESTSDGIISKTVDGIITSWNQGAEKIYGYSAKEAIGRSISLIFPPERLGELSEVLEKIRRGESISHYETVRLRKDGKQIDINLTISPIRDKTGRIIGASAIERDITEQKRVEGELNRYRSYLEDIVQARTAELRNSQRQLVEAQRIAHVGSFEWNIAKDEVIWSEELYRIFCIEGQDSTRSLGEHMTQLVHPDDQDYVRALFEKACRDKKPFEYQHRGIRRDGSICILRGRAEVFADAAGNPLKIIGFIQDITKLKQAENALRESEKKFRLIVENAQEGIWTIDKEAKVTFVNFRFADMLGYSVDEILGKSLFSFMAEQNAALAQYYFERCKQGIGERVEFELLHKDGLPVYASLATTPFFDDSGHFIGAIALVTDITERKQVENALRETSDYLEKLIQYANAPIIVWNPDTTIARFNRAFEHLTGYAADEVIGRRVDILFSETNQNESLHKLTRALSGEYWQAVEIPIRGKTGDIHYVLWNSANIYAEDGITLLATIAQGIDISERKQAEDKINFLAKLPAENPNPIMRVARDGKILYANSASLPLLTEWSRAIGEYLPDKYYQLIRESFDSRQNREMELSCNNHVFSFFIAPIADADYANLYGRDITGYKRAEEENAKIQVQLLQSQKMEAIGILAGGIAHDFNNLLTTIQGYTSMAMMKVDQADRLFRDLNRVHLAADRASNLTRQLLLFSRKQPMEAVPLNLNRTVDNLIKMLHRLIGEDILINTELGPDLWSIQADEGNIEQVIMNIVVNARDAMPNGGRLSLRTKNVTFGENFAAAAIPEARPGRYVRLSIEDTGAGMDKETISRIFEPFFTTKGMGKGTGLGLAVVYGIVKQHKGWIDISSEPGKGAVFHIYLPASSLIPEEDSIDGLISLQGLQGNGERILVVEDEEDVRRMTVRVLRENGYTVTEASNAQEALTIFEQKKEEFNLVLSDVVLPDQSGPELIEQFLLHYPALKVLLTSGYTDQKSQWPLIQKRGFSFLQKPFNPHNLLRTLREIIEPDTAKV